MKAIIITTFRKGLSFDDNFYNLLAEKENLQGRGINSRIVAGSFEGVTEYSLLIENIDIITISEVEKIADKYFQESYLIINNKKASLVSTEISNEKLLTELRWKEVTREKAVENGDYTWDKDKEKFYIGI